MTTGLKRLTPEAIAYGRQRWDLVHKVRELLADDDPRDPDDLSNEELQQIIDIAAAGG